MLQNPWFPLSNGNQNWLKPQHKCELYNIMKFDGTTLGSTLRTVTTDQDKWRVLGSGSGSLTVGRKTNDMHALTVEITVASGSTNVQFEIDDCCDTWTYSPNSFDFIHVRGLYGCVADWDGFYKQAFRYVVKTSHKSNGGEQEIAIRY